MNDPGLPNAPASSFGGNPSNNRSERNWAPWIVTIVLIALLVGLTYLVGGGRSNVKTAPTTDPYANRLPLSHLHVSQASNFAGDQLTYVEGTITNRGNRTVTAITARVQFPTDSGDHPQVELVPFNLVRTTQPYVDTEPLSAAPLKPGTSQDFRLIFDDVSPAWNQQVPQIQLEDIATR